MNYYLLMMGKLILIALLGMLLLRALWMFIKCYEKFLITDIIAGIRFSSVKGKRRILLATIAFCILLVLVAAEQGNQQASLNIALTYPEASTGLNPNGSRYNMSDITCDEVLQSAIELGGFQSLTVEKLKSALSVVPDGKRDAATGDLVSTQFLLTFTNNRNTKNIRGNEAVHAVAEAYRAWFIKKYTSDARILNLSFSDMDAYDYPNLKSYLAEKVMEICNYSSAYNSKNGSFISAKTGESFNSINTKGWDIYNTGLENLNSYILVHGLSKDAPEYMSRLQFNYTKMCKTYQENMKAYGIHLRAIDKYANDMATVVYIPTYDTDNTFYMSKTKIGIDHFASNADELSKDASTVMTDILNDRYLMNQLADNSGTEENYREAEKLSTSLMDQIRSLALVLKRTVQDYMESESNGFLFIVKPEEQYAFKYIRFVMMGLLFGTLLYMNKVFSMMLHNKGDKTEGEKA